MLNRDIIYSSITSIDSETSYLGSPFYEPVVASRKVHVAEQSLSEILRDVDDFGMIGDDLM